MVTSNPSPRYVKAAVEAFKTGSYDGVSYSGKYGDLGATVAAIFLDPEARSTTLDADPLHGSLREPLMKVIHVLKSLGYQSKDQREVVLSEIINSIGMEAMDAPSVFGFYDFDYVPPGAIADNNM